MNKQFDTIKQKSRMLHKLYYFCSFLLLFIYCSTGYAQTTYPVQSYTQLTPPYTPFVPSYYTGTQQKLKITLINTDMQQPVLNVYLRIKIVSSSFSLITPAEVYTPPIELQAGVPMQLAGNDLAVYFKRENIRVSGGQNEFFRTQLLPDNFYRFHFEVYEVRTNKLLSNPNIGFAQAMIAAGDPPILNLPESGSIIKEDNIPAIFFSWTPKHMNSVALAYGTEYEISLAEIYDKQVPAENAFQFTPPLYKETIRSTSFIYTIAQPILIPGMRYAWQIRAIAKEGVEDANVFKNGGFSPIFWFDYAADCKTVDICGAVFEDGHINITWVDIDAMEYTVEYRKKGSQRWYTATVSKGMSAIYNLQFGQEYEYRIGTRCIINDVFQYNNIKAFRMPDRIEKGPNCGLMPNVNLANQTPAVELQHGLPVLAGDFPVFITKVSGSGRFTGEGYVGIPYLQGAQIAVRFENIVVNTDNQLIGGFFETKYDAKNNNMLWDADQTLTGGKGVGDIRSGEDKAAFKVDYTIDPNAKALPVKADGTTDKIEEGKDYAITKGENGKYTFVITDSEGKEHKVEADRMPATIEDREGNVYEVNEKGEVKAVSKNSGVKLDSSTMNNPRTDIATLSFRANNNTRYALDEYRNIYSDVTEYYIKYKIEGTKIEASGKFMLPDTSDEIEVYVKNIPDNSTFIADSVRFVTGTGKEYQARYNSGSKSWTLTVVASTAGDGQELFAIQKLPDGSYATLGKLNIFTYEPLERTVTLVPVNGEMNGLNKQAVEKGLNDIYNKIGINWTVNVLDEPFNYTPKNGSTFNVTGSGLFSTLTDDMKAINEAFKQSGHYQTDGLYLFIIANPASDKGEINGTNGDMPRGAQFGYLFPDASVRTIAHEVGHGAFSLEHPFSRAGRNSFKKQGDLAHCLMDYAEGTEFCKLEWDATRVPGMVIGLFQKDRDGMILNMFAQETEQSLQINNLGDEISFYIGNKKYTFTFREKTQNLTNAQFSFGNKTFVVASFVKDGTFAGFYEKNAYQALQDKDKQVDLASTSVKQLEQFKAYELIRVEELSTRSTELKDALIESNNYEKVKAIIVLSQSLSNDEYLNAFNTSGTDKDCRIELDKKRTYTDQCLDRYINALAGALNKEVEYFDPTCNCIVKKSADELLGNSDHDFQKWFTDSIGGAGAIKLLEDKIYETNLARYTDNIARGLYGTDEYGLVSIPQSIKEKVRKEARKSAFPAIKGMWAIERSGADPNGLVFNLSPISFERFSYYYYRALATTSEEDAKEILTDVGLQVAIQWAFEVIPAIKTAKGNLAKWSEVKVKPGDLISEIENKGYHIIDGNEEAIIITNASKQQGRVPITARNLDNVRWVDDILTGNRVILTENLEILNGVKAFRVSKGSNSSKVVIIGRNMDDVRLYKEGLESKGIKVEIFADDVIPQAARDEFKGFQNKGIWVKDVDIPNTLMYKANKEWIERMAKEGYDIYDIGNLKSLAGDGLMANWYSVFYEMERVIIFP